jgi:hypothetical protein
MINHFHIQAQNHQNLENDQNLLATHYENQGCFVTNFVIQFLNYKGQLQLIVFICCE